MIVYHRCLLEPAAVEDVFMKILKPFSSIPRLGCRFAVSYLHRLDKYVVIPVFFHVEY